MIDTKAKIPPVSVIAFNFVFTAFWAFVIVYAGYVMAYTALTGWITLELWIVLFSLSFLWIYIKVLKRHNRLRTKIWVKV